jgi:hypothetical protein
MWEVGWDSIDGIAHATGWMVWGLGARFSTPVDTSPEAHLRVKQQGHGVDHTSLSSLKLKKG